MGTAELTPEETQELVARMTDEELMGVKEVPSRPGSGNSKKNFKGLMGELSRPASANAKPPGSRPSSQSSGSRIPGRDDLKSKPHLAQAASTGVLRPISVAEVRNQRKESFHFKRQRRWLEIRNKQGCLSFTEQEISDFRRFFDALAKGKDTITLDRFEDMLVCLDLAKSRKDVRDYLDSVRDNLAGNEIGFADFLKTFESQLDSSTMDVLKLLLQGTYDARDLDFTTFISERRRELILSATGARGTGPQGPSSQIVSTFSDLLEDRCYHDFGGSTDKSGEDGVLLMGGLGTMWQVACVQHGLAPNLTAEERSASIKKSLPLSPRTVVDNVVKACGPKTLGVHRMGGTVIIEADRISA